MPISDLIEKGELYKCGPNDAVRDIVRIMEEHDVGAVLVEEGGRPVGIVTDRDIVLRCIADSSASANPAETKVVNVMSPSLECVEEEAGVQDILRVMKVRKIRRVPVVDSSGKAIGLLSSDDLLRLLAKEMQDLTEAVVPDIHKGRELRSA